MVNIRSEIWRRSLWKATFLCSTIHVEFSWYALKYAQIKNMFPWIKYLQNVFAFLFSLLLFHLHEQILLSSVTFTIFPCFSAVAISDSHISRGRSLINSFLSKFIWYLLTTQQAWTVPYWCSYPKDQTLRTNLTFKNSNTMLRKPQLKLEVD